MRTRLQIHRLNAWFSKPIAVIIVLLVMTIFFGYRVSEAQRQNREILRDTHQLVEDSRVSIKHLQTIIEAQKITVDELKADNANQTKLIACLLIIHGENTAISEAGRAECENTIRDPSFATPTEQPSTPPPTQENAQANQQPPTPQPPEEPEQPPTPPREILGIPLCLPIVDLCVEQ